MKLLLTIFIAFLTYSCVSKTEGSIADLEVAIQEFNDAFEKGDTLQLSSMITNNYVHTNSSWKSFGKSQWMKYMKARSKKLQRGELIIHQYMMEEVSIESHDQTAIVTAKILSSGEEDGVSFEKAFRVTNLWVYDGSRWLRAGFHDTAIKKPTS
ncbi:nuclear transport factor 2 family protein [Ekhidna sp.]